MAKAEHYWKAAADLRTACIFYVNVTRGLTDRRVEFVLTAPVFDGLRERLAESASRLHLAVDELHHLACLCERRAEVAEADEADRRWLLDALTGWPG
jgi:hypothetical protein